MGSVTLLTGPVRSGKTTVLRHYIHKFPQTHGFLCPDRDGLRYLYHLPSGEWYPFQVEHASDDSVTVGRFAFLHQGFATAQQWLAGGCQMVSGTFIVDEIGWFELQGKGLEPALSAFVHHIHSAQTHLHAMFVVREALVDEVVRAYHLQHAAVLTTRDFSAVYGLAP